MTIYESKKMAKISLIFRPIAKLIGIFMPNLASELRQSSINSKKEDFISIGILISLIYSILIFLTINFLLDFFNINNNLIFLVNVLSAILIFIFNLFSILNYPKLLLIKKIRNIDNSLLFALRHLLIKLRSGVPFFESLTGIAYNDYGQVSNELKKAIKDIQSGASEIEALERISLMNPSYFFRKFIAQVVNSIRAGNDIGLAVAAMVEDLENDNHLKIKEFSSKLSPIALMYIIFTVIFPSIIITIFSIIGFFFNLAYGSILLYAIPALLIIFNLIFISIIKSNIPSWGGEY